MAHILLTILKILGIIILCVLGVIIFVLVALLFASFRYSVNASKREDESIGESYVKAKVTWMWIILRCSYIHDKEKSDLKIRFFGIDILKILNNKSKKKSKKKLKKSKKPVEKVEKVSKETVTKEQQVPEKQADVASKTNMQSDIEENKQEANKLNVFQKIKNKIKNLKDKLISIKNKLKDIFNKIGFYKEELGKDENKAAIKFVWNKVKEVLNHIKPRKLKGRIRFGMESPDKTGQALGIIAIFYPVFAKNFVLKPDFTDKCLEGNIIAKGRIRIFTLLVICIKLIKSIEFKKINKLIGK